MKTQYSQNGNYIIEDNKELYWASTMTNDNDMMKWWNDSLILSLSIETQSLFIETQSLFIETQSSRFKYSHSELKVQSYNIFIRHLSKLASIDNQFSWWIAAVRRWRCIWLEWLDRIYFLWAWELLFFRIHRCSTLEVLSWVFRLT